MALGAVGYQSGCLPKQPLRFIINTVTYEAPLCAPHQQQCQRSCLPGVGLGVSRWGWAWKPSAWLWVPPGRWHLPGFSPHHGIPGLLKWPSHWFLFLQALFIHSFIHSFTHSLIQEVFIKCLLFARSWSELSIKHVILLFYFFYFLPFLKDFIYLFDREQAVKRYRGTQREKENLC